jgi:NAD(P)H dehydrogenase (quinone)
MILVLGATGHLGSAVISQLLKNTSFSNIVAFARNESKTAGLREKNVEVRIGTYDDVSSLDRAMKGIEKVLLISSNGPNRLQQHKNVVAAAKRAGVKHIAYTGIALKDMSTASLRPYMEDLLQTEYFITTSGMSYTILRNSLYTGGTPLFGGENIFKTGIFLPAGNGKVAFALRREMGEAAANVLVQNGHENKTYQMTGSALTSYEDVARELSVLTGGDVKYTDADPATFPDMLKKFGLPPFVALLIESFSNDVRNHQFEIQTNELEKLLGRKPATLSAALKEVYNL